MPGELKRTVEREGIYNKRKKELSEAILEDFRICRLHLTTFSLKCWIKYWIKTDFLLCFFILIVFLRPYQLMGNGYIKIEFSYSYVCKSSNKHYAQQLCSVNRPFSLNN